MTQCSNLTNEASQTIALAFQLFTDQGIKKSPSHLINAIQSKKFQESVARALKKEAEILMNAPRKNKKLDDKGMLLNTLKASASSLGKAMESQIKKTTEYSRLKTNLKELECSFNKTKVGVFVDRNQTWLIIIGSVAGIAGSVGLYYAKSGDLIASALPSLAKDKLKIKVAGALEIGANLTTFKPSTRELGVEAFTKLQWEKVQAHLKVAATFKGADLTQASSSGKIVVPIAKNAQVSGIANFMHKRPALRPRIHSSSSGSFNNLNSFDLGLQIDIKPNSNTKLNIWYKYKDPATERSEHAVGIGIQFSF